MTADEYDRLAVAKVSPEAARAPLYPIVWVTKEGAVHELDAEDRAYMEERFHPCDGARPWVKYRYDSKDGWGSIEGFCFRKDIPKHITISATPKLREPAKTALEQLREYTEAAGLTLVEQPDGSFVTSPPARPASPPKKWWQFWRRS